jgi:peptidoglycan/xylan/chitin deacetylase (PgdA/CDA1 family)
MKTRWILPCLLVLALALAIFPGCSQLNMNAKNASPSPATPDLAGGKERDVRVPHPLSLADLRAKYKSTFLLQGPATKREIALTFDDAPDMNFTPKVLDALKREGVKATFFVVGNRVEAHPDIMKRILKEGHAVGNHSYNHANLPKLPDAEFRDQIIRTDEIIRQYAGYTPKFVRPPYGNISEEQIKWLASQHKLIVNWNVDSLDWKNLTPEQVEANVLSAIQPGSIILQHAAGGKGEDLSCTVYALPKIIRKLREDGIKLVTIPELLETPAGVAPPE